MIIRPGGRAEWKRRLYGIRNACVANGHQYALQAFRGVFEGAASHKTRLLWQEDRHQDWRARKKTEPENPKPVAADPKDLC